MGKHPYRTDYKVGIDNLKKFGLDIHNPVFPLSALLVLGFISAALIEPDKTNLFLNSMKSGVIEIFDGFITWAANAFVIFCVLLAISPLGKLRIGGVGAQPDHGNLSWFAMLFAAGMGIGLMFWSVAEPLAYATGWYHTPLNAEPDSPEAYQAEPILCTRKNGLQVGWCFVKYIFQLLRIGSYHLLLSPPPGE